MKIFTDIMIVVVIALIVLSFIFHGIYCVICAAAAAFIAAATYFINIFNRKKK